MSEKTVRMHWRGEPFRRDIPDGCKPKSRWEQEGFILKPDAEPTAWILMGDNCHEYAVFAADQVVPGEVERTRAKVSAEKLEKLFERYQTLEKKAISLEQQPGLYSIVYVDGEGINGELIVHTRWLSGHYDRDDGRITKRGSREKAYARLLELIAKLEGKEQ